MKQTIVPIDLHRITIKFLYKSNELLKLFHTLNVTMHIKLVNELIVLIVVNCLFRFILQN
jgi:hypothetical protein